MPLFFKTLRVEAKTKTAPLAATTKSGSAASNKTIAKTCRRPFSAGATGLPHFE